jgi:hypothetical protein
MGWNAALDEAAGICDRARNGHADRLAAEVRALKRGDTATPTETEWEVRFGVTALGAFTAHIISAAPTEVKRVFVLLAPALAWMYPGPGETRALQEIERLCAENKKLRAYYDTFDSILGGTDPGKTPVQP